jgi:hypothetical protein
VDPRTGLSDVEKRKILLLLGLELRSKAVEPVGSRYIPTALSLAPRRKNDSLYVSRLCY